MQQEPPFLAVQVKISELDDFAQQAFAGYKTLNRIQSRIYPTAYHSNENILVSGHSRHNPFLIPETGYCVTFRTFSRHSEPCPPNDLAAWSANAILL